MISLRRLWGVSYRVHQMVAMHARKLLHVAAFARKVCSPENCTVLDQKNLTVVYFQDVKSCAVCVDVSKSQRSASYDARITMEPTCI